MYTQIKQNSFYSNNAFLLENNITENRRKITCSNCGSFPKYFFNNETTNIDLKCLKCSQKQTLDIQSIIDFAKPQNFKLEPCNFKKHKEQAKATSYCLKCRKWLCKDCHDIHNQIFYDEYHKLTKNIAIIQTCEKHNDFPYKYYCICCEQSLCKECYENICPITLIKHKLMKKDENTFQYILTRDDIEMKLIEKSKIMKDIRFYLINMKKQKQDIINQLHNIISQIENNFKVSYEHNKKLFNFFETIMSNISHGDYYYSLQNLEFLPTVPQRFNLDINNFNYETLNDYIDYLHKDFKFNFFLTKNKETTVKTIKRKQLNVEPTAFALYNDKCYMGYENGYIDVYNNFSNSMNKLFSIRKQFLPIIQFNKYKANILSSSGDGIINIWKEEQKEQKFILHLKSTLNLNMQLHKMIIYEKEKTPLLVTCSNELKYIKIWNMNLDENSPKKILTFNFHLRCDENVVTMMNVKTNFLLVSTVKESLSLWSITKHTNLSIINNIPCKGINHLVLSNDFVYVAGKQIITIIKLITHCIQEEQINTVFYYYELIVVYKLNVDIIDMSMNNIKMISILKYEPNEDEHKFNEKLLLFCNNGTFLIMMNSNFIYVIKKETVVSAISPEENKFYKIDLEKEEVNKVVELNWENLLVHEFPFSSVVLKEKEESINVINKEENKEQEINAKIKVPIPELQTRIKGKKHN